MELQQLHRDFSVCKVTSADTVDLTKPFTFLSVTDDEISLVCETASVPEGTTDIEHGWKCLKISGILDFGLIGIIAKIATQLAAQEISVFVISTFNTDYILLKAEKYEQAVRVLSESGYSIR